MPGRLSDFAISSQNWRPREADDTVVGLVEDQEVGY